ncbi:MAG: PorT family protein [Bacteroidia bacterium]|nr:PorT family protein [Bacteroidia bacterium]
MRQKLGIVAILVSFCLGLKAQETNIEFGLGTTPFISWFSPSNKAITNGGASPSFGFGAKINYNIGTKYALGCEINLQNISSSIKAENVIIKHHSILDTVSNFSVDYNFQYLDLPVFIKMHTMPEGNRSYYGEFGASIGFLLKQRGNVNSDKYNKEDVNFNDHSGHDEHENFEVRSTRNSDIYQLKANPIRAGLMFGAGVNFHLKNSSRVELGLRYHMGLNDILAETKWTANSHGVGLNIGFIF